MTQTAILQKFINYAVARFEFKVERRFEKLVAEGKSEDTILLSLAVIKQAIQDLALPDTPLQQKTLKEGAVLWLRSEDSASQAFYLGFKKANWCDFINSLLDNEYISLNISNT